MKITNVVAINLFLFLCIINFCACEVLSVYLMMVSCWKEICYNSLIFVDCG